MAEEPIEASVSLIHIEDDVEPSVTREILGYLGIFRTFWEYLENFGGIFRGKTGNFRM